MRVVVLDEDLDELISKLELGQMSGHPLVCTRSVDPRYLLAMLHKLCEREVRVYTLDTLSGFVMLAPGGKRRRLEDVSDIDAIPDALTTFLMELEALEPAVDVVLSIALEPSSLELPSLRASMEALASEIYARGLSARVLVRGMKESPWSTSFELSPPADENLKQYVKNVLGGLNKKDTNLTMLAKREIIEALRGLTAPSVQRILERSLRGRSERTEFLSGLEQARREELSASAGLEVVPRARLNQMGGMEVLKRHLEYDAVIFQDPKKAIEQHIDLPRGILLVGLPGCGKSLAAKVSASVLDLPLLRLDVGSLMGKYLGESEERMRRALDSVEASAPCVLWIDELEKALGGSAGGEGTGTDTRMLGLLLTWMQENDFGVYVVATANSVEKLPPELLRRGRFDESFFVGLPNKREREAILKIHLEKRGLELDKDGLREVAGEVTKGFSGAEIEALVKLTHRQRFVLESEEDLAQDIIAQAEEMTPFARQWEGQLKRMMKPLDEQGFKSASLSPDKKLPPAVPRRQLVAPLTTLAAAPGAVILRPEGRGWTMELSREGERLEVRIGEGDLPRVSYAEALTIIQLRATASSPDEPEGRAIIASELEGKASAAFRLDGRDYMSLGLRYRDEQLYARFDEDDTQQFPLSKLLLPPEDVLEVVRAGFLDPQLYGCLSGEFALDVGETSLTFHGEGSLREAHMEPSDGAPTRFQVRARGASILLCEIDADEVVWGELFWADGGPHITISLPPERATAVVLDLSHERHTARLYIGDMHREITIEQPLPAGSIEGFIDGERAHRWISEVLGGVNPRCSCVVLVPSHMTPWARAGLLDACEANFSGGARALDRGDAAAISYMYRRHHLDNTGYIITLHGGHGAVHVFLHEIGGGVARRSHSRTYFYDSEEVGDLDGLLENTSIMDWVGDDLLDVVIASPCPIEESRWTSEVRVLSHEELIHRIHLYHSTSPEFRYFSSVLWSTHVSGITLVGPDAPLPIEDSAESRLTTLGKVMRFEVGLLLMGMKTSYALERRTATRMMNPQGAKNIGIIARYDREGRLKLHIAQDEHLFPLELEDHHPTAWGKKRKSNLTCRWRVLELARELGYANQEMVAVINDLGIGIRVSNVMTSLTEDEVNRVKAALEAN